MIGVWNIWICHVVYFTKSFTELNLQILLIIIQVWNVRILTLELDVTEEFKSTIRHERITRKKNLFGHRKPGEQSD